MRLVWQTEVIPPARVRGTFVMLYKKGPRANFGNYRAIGLMCHSYKLLSMLVLHRMQDAVESRLAETQDGFRRERGCRDNVLLLRLLMDAVLRAGKEAVVTFIDYRAAFDTISHRFLDESLAAAGVQPKIRRIVKAIYTEATGMVRLRLPSGETMCSEPFPVRRGVIQGDIFSPQCFTLGLDRISRLHDIAGQGIGGPSLCDVTASKLEYADDVGLLDWTAAEASEGVSALASGSRASASMEMSAPKSKGMHVHIRERLPVSTEVEVEALDLPHSCPESKRSFPTSRGLAVHRARWCRPGRITGRSYQEEATTPSYDLLTAVRTQRHHCLSHILRMTADRLVRRAVLALGQRDGPPYQPGSIMMDTPLPLTELLQRAADRRGWARDGRSVSSPQESP